jgi:uncharacterized protein (TIGR02453 family)
MFSKSTLDFLVLLKANNNKEWFDKNRALYEAAKTDLNGIVSLLITELGKLDKSIIGLEPKNCVFRINRDLRFSNDKSPYKTNIGAYFTGGGKNTINAGYYLHLQPENSFLAGGMWMPAAPQLKAIRQEIAYNADDFKNILADKDFKKYFKELGGEKLKTAPKEYPKDHPEIELLKHKSFIVSHKMTDTDMVAKDMISNTVKAFKALYPLNTFLNTAIS